MRLSERMDGETGKKFALRTIRENIIQLELLPGSKISENGLAADMGLSRTPIGEALDELSKIKIVEIYPQKGCLVSLIDYELVEESRFIREVLECSVVEQVCARATPEDLQRLDDNVTLQKFYLEKDNFEKLLHLDNEFHQMLFEIARKPQAYFIMKSTAVHFDRVRNMSLSVVRDLKIVQDHRLILEAIRQNTPAAAHAYMETHLNRYKIDEEVIRDKYAEYFKPSSLLSDGNM